MSADEVRDKFLANAMRRIPAEQAGQIAAIVLELETLPDIGQLTEACAVPPATEVRPRSSDSPHISR